MMKSKLIFLRQAAISLLLVALILLSSMLLAQQVQKSKVYTQSKIVGSLFTQESSVDLGEILKDKKNLEMVLKFGGAVTSAYINFELIPVNEAHTFSAVFASINQQITVDKFEYQRRNLAMDGAADSVEGYEAFVHSLREQHYFESISGDYYIATDDTVRFRIICVSVPTANALAFAPAP